MTTHPLHLFEGSVLLEIFEKKNPNDARRTIHRNFLNSAKQHTVDFEQLQHSVDTPGFDFNYQQTFFEDTHTFQTIPLFLVLLDALTAQTYYPQARELLHFCQKNGADINFQSDFYPSILFTHRHCQAEWFRLFIEQGACLHIQNKEGQNPITYHISRGSFEVAQVLLSLKKDLTPGEVQLYQHNIEQYEQAILQKKESEKNSLCQEIFTYDNSALSALLLRYQEKFSLEQHIAVGNAESKSQSLKI